MAFNKADLYPRVEARAKVLGKTVTDVLPKGYALFADSKASSSPRIDTMEKLADNLEWSLCQLLCASDERASLRPDLLHDAVVVAIEAIRSDRHELLPGAIISAYEYRVALEADGEPFDQVARAHMIRSLRAQNRAR
jgi:hypothetical protein